MHSPLKKKNLILLKSEILTLTYSLTDAIFKVKISVSTDDGYLCGYFMD